MPHFGMLIAFVFAIWPAMACAEGTFDERDANGDGVISFEEHAASVSADLRQMDRNDDGKITVAEYAAYLRGIMPGASVQVSQTLARCMFKGLRKTANISTDDMRAYNDRVFRWLAGDDGQLTRDDASRTAAPKYRANASMLIRHATEARCRGGSMMRNPTIFLVRHIRPASRP